MERRQAPAPSSADLPVPDFLLAEAGELIDGQYRDRPGLRPVLDAVLAALPALGPVTVQARKTLVSLVTPRRTFAVIQATTRTRLDLGLRLEDQQPGGRLLAARGLGAATARIALTAPQDVDDEVLDWPVPGNAPSARWEATVTVRRDAGGLDFSGPYVRGDRTDRNLFVVWGSVPGDGTLRLVAGSKLALGTIDPCLIEDALHPGHLLVARIRLTRTGTLKGSSLTWSAEPADANTRKS